MVTNMKAVCKRLALPVGLLAGFVLWTAAVCLVDVQPIGPEGSRVGLASMNRFVRDLVGVNWTLYTLTDWLGLIPFGVCAGFGVQGLVQWIRRKRLLAVDRSLLILGGFYVLVMVHILPPPFFLQL